MRKTHMHGYRPIATAFTIAFTALALSACNSSSSSNNNKTFTQVAKAFNCEGSDEQGARVICIGSANDLSDESVQRHLISELVNAQTGDTYVLPQGRYNFTNTIEYNGMTDNEPVSHLTFRGAGMDKTIIDTSKASADGFLINNTDNLIFEDFGIYESNNNALKIKGTDGLIIRRMATVWETDYKSTNGAYGMYPVETKNVLIEDSFVKGSADAGIYVGQSDNIIVRNNIAEKNVAGIEIENSTRADVYGNTAIGNTGGILIFDLPIGNGKYGHGVRVFNNHVEANNAPNFANKSDFAGGVHIVPPGTGVIVLSTSDVEIYHNVIKDHQTTSVAVASYLLADDDAAAIPNQDIGKGAGQVSSYGEIHPFAPIYFDGWSPLVRNIHIHDNQISMAKEINNPQGELIKDIIEGYQTFNFLQPDITGYKTTVPHLLYDGIGELLANTPYPGGEDESMLMAIVAGINQIALGLHAYGLEAEAPTLIDVNKFFPYEADGAVCESNNNIDGLNLFAASVFETTPTQHTFSNDGTPRPKLEQVLTNLNPSLAGDIMTDAAGIFSCASGFIGTPVTVSFSGNEYGCTTDDLENPSCAL